MLPLLRRFWAVFIARNREFIRDRASFGWNLIFPFVVLIGFSFIFGGSGSQQFTLAVLDEIPNAQRIGVDVEALPSIELVIADDREEALLKVGQHRFDALLAASGSQVELFVHSESPKGALLERVLFGGSLPSGVTRSTVEGREVRYVDWLAPGILAMNMMFSCLFGVGFVMVRYRKMGVLRRLKATPLGAFEFLAAQVTSRLLLALGTTLIVFVGADLLLDFTMVGRHLDLFVVFALGAICLTALGLLMASRTASEELAGGLLNLITMPMMVLSGVWFSLESAPDWLRGVAKIFPLTHLNDAARAIMNDGATLLDVGFEAGLMVVLTFAFLGLGAALFRWEST